MLSYICPILRRIALLRRLGIVPTLAIFILGISSGVLCMLMLPALYLDLSDRLSWRFRWPTLMQVRLEKSLITVHLQGDSLIDSGAKLLFGDSHLHRLPESQLMGAVQNYAISGETAQRLSQRLAWYGSVHRASQVVLLTGRNDLAIGTAPSAIAASIGQSLSLIPSTIPVLVLGIPPAVEPDARVTARKEANVLIEKWCAIRPGCRFVSLEAFANERGQLRSRFDAGDGVHLSHDAYAMLVQVLTKPQSWPSLPLFEGEK